MKSEMRLFRFIIEDDKLHPAQGPYQDKSLFDLRQDGWSIVHMQYVDEADTLCVFMERPLEEPFTIETQHL